LNKLVTVLAITALLVALGLVFNVNYTSAYAIVSQSSIITADQTWSTSGSLHTLVAPVTVGKNAILTIAPGAIVDLNGFYIQVNGTLIVKGTDTLPVTISNGSINYASESKGWNQNTHAGCIIENTNLNNTSVTAETPLKIDNCTLSTASIAGQSLVTASTIIGLTVSGDATISRNHIGALQIKNGSPSISENHIRIIAGSSCSPLISNNVIESIGGCASSYTMPLELSSLAPVISGNTINRGIQLTALSPVIVNNTLNGYLFGEDPTINDVYGSTKNVYLLIGGSGIITVSEANGSPLIYNNTLTGHDYTYTHRSFMAPDNLTPGGVTFNDKASGVTTAGIIITATSTSPTIAQNKIFNCSTGIEVTAADELDINNNYVTNPQGTNSIGIKVTNAYQAIIDHNYFDQAAIFNKTRNLLIQNNTFSDATIEISSTNPSTLAYNNIQFAELHSIILDSSGDVNAPSNWWGTTDTNCIVKSFHDSRVRFGLGTVNYQPTLSASNLDAMPQLNQPIAGITYPTQTAITPNLTSQQQSDNNAVSKGVDWTIVLLSAILIALMSTVIALLLLRRNCGKNSRICE